MADTTTRWWLDTRDKPALLWAFLDHFAADSIVTLKGKLADLGVTELPGAVVQPEGDAPTKVGHGNLDTVRLPLSPTVVAELKRCLAGPNVFSDMGALREVEITHAGTRVFLAGDNFHRECVSAMPPTPESFLDELVERGAIRSYAAA